MAQATAPADRLTPVLIALTGYYVVAGFASLTNLAVAIWVMSLVYCVPVVTALAALAWFAVRPVLARRVLARRVLARRGGARRPLPV